MKTSHDVLSWIIESCKPKAIWCAGQFEEYCPPGFESRSLTRVLRCPPMVQRVLQHTSNELGVVGEQTKGQGLRKYNQSYVPSRFVLVNGRSTLRASLSGSFLQTLPDLVTPLKGLSLSPCICPATQSAPSERFGYR